MISAYKKEYGKDAESVSFLTEAEFNDYVKDYLGKDTKVLIPSRDLQIIISPKAYINEQTKARPNMLVRMEDSGKVEALCGNLIFTCIVEKNGAVTTDDCYKEAYKKLCDSQNALFEEWFF